VDLSKNGSVRDRRVSDTDAPSKRRLDLVYLIQYAQSRVLCQLGIVSLLVAFGLAICSEAFAQPVSSPVAIAVQINSSTTTDLAPFITGGGITGIAVSSAPAHGTATVNGTNTTYTPASNYFGPDTFSYIAFGVGGSSTPAVVTVTVAGRPDPAADRAIVGLLAAQSETLRRFSRTQISNFQRRLESLHRRSSTEQTVTASPGTGEGSSAPVRLAAGPLLYPPSNATDTARMSNSVNLAALSDGVGSRPGAGQSGLPNFWFDGILNFGTRDATASRNGLEFRTNGVSLGLDRRINDRWVLGIGAGFSRDRTDIGSDGTQNLARAFSMAAYGSFQPTENTFVDGLIGVGSVEFDTRRFVAPANDYARGNRDGRQVFGSVSAGFERRSGGLLVSPYARLDLFADRLNQSTESGARQYALTYFGETSRSAQGSAGVRAELIRATSFGWVVPRVRTEYRHDFQGTRMNSAAYADLTGGPQFALPAGAPIRDVLVLGLGADFVRRDGFTLGIDYQLAHAFTNDTDHAIRIRISKDLDGRGSSASSEVPLPVTRPLGIQIDAGYTFDDNVTRSRTPGEKLFDRSYSVNLSKVEVHPLTENTRARLTYFLGGEKFEHYDGLSKLGGGVRGEYQYRSSAEFTAPTLAFFGRASADAYESSLRSDFRYSIGVSVQQSLTNRVDLSGALAHNERYGRSSVFINRDNSARITANYSLSRTETIYLSGEYRRGEIVSTGSASLENVDIAKVLVLDDAFPGRQFFSYRLEANTVLATLGYNVGFGPRDSLDLSWRRVESTPHLRPAYSTSASSYVVNQYSIVYLMRF